MRGRGPSTVTVTVTVTVATDWSEPAPGRVGKRVQWSEWGEVPASDRACNPLSTSGTQY